MPAEPAPRPARFLLAFAFANAGGTIAYLPLLTLLLPLKVEALAGDARMGVLTLTTLAGAVAASIGNLVFGMLSDRSVARGGTRRGWIAFGLALTALGYAGVAAATSPAAVVAAIVAWQVALNALLAPLLALMADEVPDGQKGLAGGLLTLASPLASLVSALVAAAVVAGEAWRYAGVMAIVVATVAPLLAMRAPPVPSVPPAAGVRRVARLDLLLAWGARLLVQIAGLVLFQYALYYFESVAPGVAPATLAPRIGHLMTLAFALPLPIAIVVGRLSDRLAARKPFLVGAAAVAAAGLATMALADAWWPAATGFAIYASGSAIFLGLHAGFAMQMLPSPAHRGRDLGLLNLANTLPALLGPALTWSLATTKDFGAVMAVLAVLTLTGGLMTLPIRSQR